MTADLAASYARLGPILSPDALIVPDWNGCEAVRAFVRSFRRATDRERRAIYRIVKVSQCDALIWCSQSTAEGAYSSRDPQALVDSLIMLALAGYHTPSKFETRNLDQYLPLPFDVARRIDVHGRAIAREAAAYLPGRSGVLISSYLDHSRWDRSPEGMGWRTVVSGDRLTYEPTHLGHWKPGSSVAITTYPAESDAELESWRQIRKAVLPNERALSVAEMRANADGETLHILATIDGELAGSGLVGRSSFGYAGLHPRVLPAMRRRGVGTALLRALAYYAENRGFTEAGSLVEDAGSLAFAERFGFREVDRQIEQIRAIGEEPAPAIPDGITIVTVAGRPELWSKAYDPFGREAIGDMATDRPVLVSREEWERDWLSWPEAMFLALDGDEIVGCAGLEYDADRPKRAEHAFTAVARPWRRRGLASAMKRLTLHFAAEHGVREVYTWTQRDNADMRALNARLGYTYGGESITVRGPLPLPD